MLFVVVFVFLKKRPCVCVALVGCLLGDDVAHEVDPAAGEVVELDGGGDRHQGVPQHARQLVPWPDSSYFCLFLFLFIFNFYISFSDCLTGYL